MKAPPLDIVAKKIAALGVPGLVLVAAMAFTGFAGAAAITAGLAMLGGPLGMLGGIALLGVMVMVSHALTEYGFELVFSRVVDVLHEEGLSTRAILAEIEGYPIGRSLKGKLRELLKSRRPRKPRRRPSPRKTKPKKT
jgi:hypothetical protein